ncbi:MAG: hypothetical protein IPJ65_09655 [Archangiaceae bacterium]|nr:hypothetical protein [Archangiaceae bacterium]
MNGWWKQPAGFAAAKAVMAAARLSDAPERRLSPPERVLLDRVYQGSVELSKVRVRAPVTGLLGMPARAFVIENTLFVPRRFLPLQAAVLVHEVCHVWQHQHGGHAYIADSLEAQLVGDGYRLEKGLREGKRWAELNCEQQATLVEEAYEQRCFDGKPLVLRGHDYTPAFEAAMHELRAGRGASFR